MTACSTLNDRCVTEENLTDVVMERWKDIGDPRLRQITQSLIKHLHGFVRDIEPTQRSGPLRSIGSLAPANDAQRSGRNSS
jgi:Catechol dioxygenase N terminus